MTLSNDRRPNSQHLLTLKAAADQLGISRRTLRRWRQHRQITTYVVANRKCILQIDVDTLLTLKEDQ